MVAGRFVAAELAPGQHRLELPAAALGLSPPPLYTEMTLHQGRRGWTILAIAGKPQAEAIAGWLRSLGARDPVAVSGKEPAVKALLAEVPAPLAHAAGQVQVERVGLGSDGSAFLQVRASRADFARLVARFEAQRTPENAVPILTARQAELLRFCKDAGYYDIPRRVTLRKLGDELGISPTALSMALRRAEARILSAYVERLRTSLPSGRPRPRAQTG